MEKYFLFKKQLFFFVFFLTSFYSHGQGYGKPKPRPIVKDSIMTPGDRNLYLVLIDSTWQLCHGGRIQDPSYGAVGYTGNYVLFYPSYNHSLYAPHYVKQTFELTNGIITKRSEAQLFPSYGHVQDTVDINKAKTDTLLNK